MLTLDLNDLRPYVSEANQRQAAKRDRYQCPLCGAAMIRGLEHLHWNCAARGHRTPATPRHGSRRAQASAFHRAIRQKGWKT